MTSSRPEKINFPARVAVETGTTTPVHTTAVALFLGPSRSVRTGRESNRSSAGSTGNGEGQRCSGGCSAVNNWRADVMLHRDYRCGCMRAARRMSADRLGGAEASKHGEGPTRHRLVLHSNRDAGWAAAIHKLRARPGPVPRAGSLRCTPWPRGRLWPWPA